LLRLGLLSALLAAAAVLAPTGGARVRANADPTLYVAYNMNCTFGITDDSGKAVSTIAPGSYQVQITTPQVFAEVDLNGIHDMTACQSFVQFQISGPGVNISTTLQDGDEDYGVLDATFLPSSTYVASDQNQPSVARLSFGTASSGSPVAPPSASGAGTSTGKGTQQTDLVGSKSATAATTANVLRGTLDATVSAKGTPKLTFKGRIVTTLAAGRYTITVVDQSKRSGFIIQETRKASKTLAAVPFVGKKSASIDLQAGQWFFYPTFVGAKSFFIVTSS
jgi:hypothetical protein